MFINILMQSMVATKTDIPGNSSAVAALCAVVAAVVALELASPVPRCLSAPCGLHPTVDVAVVLLVGSVD